MADKPQSAQTAQGIVSLLPSATEMICALGLGHRLVGVTHECDWPPWVAQLPKVTRTLIPHNASSAQIDVLVRERLKTQAALYSLDMEMLESLRPGLLVTQALCDVCAVADAEVQQAACRLPGRPRVLSLEPMSLAAVFAALGEVGAAAGAQREGRAVVEALQARVRAVEARTAPLAARPRVAFLEWIDPLFGGGHWNPALIESAGGVDVLGQPGQPSRTLRWEDVVRARPEVVFIACCGFDAERAMQDVPILEKLPGWGSLPAVRAGQVFVSDGNAYFSRPGPRLVDSLELLAHTLHPRVHPLPPGLAAAHRVLCAP